MPDVSSRIDFDNEQFASPINLAAECQDIWVRVPIS